MNNIYYHDFTPAAVWTNSWFFIALIMAVAMTVIGRSQWKRRRRRVERRFADRRITLVSGIFSAILSIIFMIETSDGIRQWGMNGAAFSEDPIFAGLGSVVITTIGFFGVSWLTLYAVGRVSSTYKAGQCFIELEEFFLEKSKKEAKAKKHRAQAQVQAQRAKRKKEGENSKSRELVLDSYSTNKNRGNTDADAAAVADADANVDEKNDEKTNNEAD